MKEVSFEENCTVHAIGDDGRFSVVILEELPDPVPAGVVVVEAPITRCRLVPNDKTAPTRIKIRGIGGDPYVQREVGIVTVNISSRQLGVVRESPPLRQLISTKRFAECCE